MERPIHKAAVLTLVVLPFLAVIVAIILLWNRYVFASDIILMVVMYVITLIGVGIGFHRLLTHQSFKTLPWIRAPLLIAGTMAFEGNPLRWASTHVAHHAHSDQEGDPHSPLDGFWHAHMGWLFSAGMSPPEKYAPHLLEDKLVMWVDKWSMLWMGLALLVPYLIGGWTALIWAGGVRIFLTTHVTWSVNSICHTFGSRDFKTSDQSRNNFWVGILAFGEGWHNNHHAFPTNAYHGMRWWQVDVSGYIIRALKFLGLAWDIKTVSPEAEAAYHERSGRSRSSLNDLVEQLRTAIANAKSELESLPDPGSEVKELALKRLAFINRFTTRKSAMQEKVARKYLQEIKDLVQRARGAVV